MAKICATCHAHEPGVMMGFLDEISIKARTLQIDFLSHKDVVNFDDKTDTYNVDSFEDIRNYIGKGFTIDYSNENGKKVATAITRFDILQTIESGEYKVEKVSKKEFTDLLQSPDVAVFDVRPPSLYKEAHIKSAGPLPAPAFDKFKANLPKDKATPLVFYGVGGCLSPTVAFNAKSLGYENVSIYTAGFPEWTKTEFTVTTADWLASAIRQGTPHVLIDIRDVDSVRKGHIPGAVSIPFNQLTTTKDNFPYQKNAPIIIYGDSKEKAAKEILSWGYRAVRILPLTFDRWLANGYPLTSGEPTREIVYTPKPKTGTVPIEEFERYVLSPTESEVIIDVRNPDETTSGMVPHAINIPVNAIAERINEIPVDKHIVLYCPSGIRAEMAVNILAKQGRKSRYLDAFIEIEEDGCFEIEEK